MQLIPTIHCQSPDEMTAEERKQEIAALILAALLRNHHQNGPKAPSENAQHTDECTTIHTGVVSVDTH